MSEIQTFLGLIAAIAALAWLAQRIKVEYPILLVMGGLILGFIPGLPQVALRPDVVFLLFLPPLLYYEAYNSSLRDFRANLRPITLYAVFLVVVTIAAVAWTAHALIPGMSWGAAVVLGAIVGPTDETAAIAIASRLHVPRKLITLIKAESLFNDATSLVIYAVALTAVVTGMFSLAMGIWQLFLDAIGGVVVGLAVGWLLTVIRRRVEDPLIQNTLSLLSGYAAYLPADALHLSGVLSAITAGIYLGRQGYTFTTAESRIQNAGMREITLFLINGILFILVGLQLHPILAGLSGATAPATLIWRALAISFVVIVVRITWIFATVYIPRAFSLRNNKWKASMPWQHAAVVSWTGLRGGISLAAALAVPLVIGSGAPFPHRPLILFLTFAVILATLVIQGLTLPALIRVLGVASDGSAEREETLARLKATRAAYDRLKNLAKEPWAEKAVVDDLRGHLKATYAHQSGRQQRSLTPEDESRASAVARIRRELTAAQSREIVRLRDEGAINDAVMHKIQRELDLEDLRNVSSAATATD
ncbi:MAG TPA: Na+/H+ antiporter [Candidatus Tumulicola sp.]|nr:Na+/H+ antiporter [Candidatus Tumulicola sp.]